MARHPQHDAISNAVRGWYTASTPAIGLTVTATEYGFLTVSDRADRDRLVLTVDSPEDVPKALAMAADFYETPDFDVWVDDRSRAQRLASALHSAGRAPAQDTTVLALVGLVRAEPGPPNMTVEDVTGLEQLRLWAEVKLQGFADDEAQPTAENIEAELEGRQGEWPVCRYQLARVAGEPVAVLGCYTGEDQMVFNLATRLPFRHRGIAQSLLRGWSKDDATPGVRSRLINCDDGGPAHALYQRLGFTDEVYWQRRYRHGE